MKFRITIDGKSYEAVVEVLEEEEAAHPYFQPPAYAPVPVPGPAANASSEDDRGISDGVCRSPVTGLVIRVHAEPGQAVEANQLLLVLEAMKMETQVAAPRAGTVRRVHVEPGNSVKANQPLLEMEWEGAPAEESKP